MREMRDEGDMIAGTVYTSWGIAWRLLAAIVVTYCAITAALVLIP